MLDKTLFIVLTCDMYLDSRVHAIQNTWGKIANVIFLTDTESTDKEILGYNTTKNYDGIQEKYLNLFTKYNFDNYDYYFFVDDDTFVNLTNFSKLELPSPNDNFSFMRKLVLNPDGTDKDGNQTGYPLFKIKGHNSNLPLIHPSGGAGYIVSQKTCKLIQNYLKEIGSLAPSSGHGDVTLGFWIRNVNSHIIFSDILWWEKPEVCIEYGFDYKTFLTIHYITPKLMYDFNSKYNVVG